MAPKMNKKIVILSIVIILILCVGGGFFWWQNQKDVRELNKNLPEGVRVVKSLMGKEYKVVNKIDGYEFRVPKEWKGIKEIMYAPERTEEGYTGVSIELEGKEGVGRSVGIDRFEEDENLNLEVWAKRFFESFGLMGEFIQDRIETIEIVKTQENVHLGGDYVYFFKQGSVVFAITSGSEEFIREIISNGKW